jgi:hypothetical protein
MDAGLLAQVYQSLTRDQIEAIGKNFSTLSTYRVEIREPRVQVKGDEATVDGILVRHITPKVGAPQSPEAPARFRLRRSGSGWVIVNLETR